MKYAWIAVWLCVYAVDALEMLWPQILPSFPNVVLIVLYGIAVRMSVMGEPDRMRRIKKSQIYGIAFVFLAEVILQTALTLKGRSIVESYAATVLVFFFTFDFPALVLSAFLAAISVPKFLLPKGRRNSSQRVSQIGL